MAPEIVRKLVGGVWRTVEENAASGGGSQAVLVTTLAISSAEILDLHNTPVTLVEAAANTVLTPLRAFWYRGTVSDAYSLGGPAQVGAGDLNQEAAGLSNLLSVADGNDAAVAWDELFNSMIGNTWGAGRSGLTDAEANSAITLAADTAFTDGSFGVTLILHYMAFLVA